MAVKIFYGSTSKAFSIVSPDLSGDKLKLWQIWKMSATMTIVWILITFNIMRVIYVFAINRTESRISIVWLE